MCDTESNRSIVKTKNSHCIVNFRKIPDKMKLFSLPLSTPVSICFFLFCLSKFCCILHTPHLLLYAFTILLKISPTELSGHVLLVSSKILINDKIKPR